MKKILSLLVCLALLCAWMLPVAATASTEPTTTTGVPQPVPGASNVMAIVCLVLVLAGGVYLFIKFRRSGRNR